MSSSTYTLKIDIDDSKIREIEKRLMAIVGGKQGGGGIGATVTKAASGGDIGKNIAKLGMIAAGVAGILIAVKKIAEMTVQSSPMLMQMLKLLNFGIMLILRPIGDFIGFFLRPLIVYFLRSIILPWYRLARPLMQKWGQWLGSGAVQNLSSGLAGTWAIITGDWETVSRLTTEGNAKIQAFWDGAVLSVGEWITSLNLPSFEAISTGITEWIDTQLSGLVQWWYLIWSAITTWINENVPKLPSWEGIKTGFDLWVTDNLAFLPSWETIGTAVKGIQDGLLGILESIRIFFIDLGAKFGIDLTGLLGSKITQAPTPAPVGITDSQAASMIHPWLTETPTADMSDKTRGHGGFG